MDTTAPLTLPRITVGSAVERKRLLVQKAEATKERLVFVVQALKTLFADQALTTLLHSEDMDTLPKTLALRLQGVG